jgi:hypothetical protein
MKDAEEKIDIDLIREIVLEINQRIRSILIVVPIKEQEILRHAAAASIHFAMFARDIFQEYCKDDMFSEKEKIFLEECGCDFFGRKK